MRYYVILLTRVLTHDADTNLNADFSYSPARYKSSSVPLIFLSFAKKVQSFQFHNNCITFCDIWQYLNL